MPGPAGDPADQALRQRDGLQQGRTPALLGTETGAGCPAPASGFAAPGGASPTSTCVLPGWRSVLLLVPAWETPGSVEGGSFPPFLRGSFSLRAKKKKKGFDGGDGQGQAFLFSLLSTLLWHISAAHW